MKFSIIIPARDEERFLGGGLEACRLAANPYPDQVETIVVLNRCRDRTEQIAREAGARIVQDDRPNLAAIRNTGARAARGEMLITVDADSRMAPGTLRAVESALASGRYIGGGVPIRPERLSLGLLLTGLALACWILPLGISAGLFWCRRGDFEAIGGFDERRGIAEDIDFALRLKAHGRRQGKRFGTLWRAPLVTSCRKFDHFGDWFGLKLLLRHPRLVGRTLRSGKNDELAAKLFYNFPH
jgi:glycosyltransferase involved in cell wall biosynthesis